MYLSDFIFFTITLSAFSILTLLATWEHIGKYSDWEQQIHKVLSNRLNENIIIPNMPAFPKLSKKPKPSCLCKNWFSWNGLNLDTPPCCKNGYIYAFKSLKKYLDVNNITYSLSNGTLLGAVRCGEMIQYDYNIDITIYHSISKTRDVLNLWHIKSPVFSNMTIIVNGLPWPQIEFSGSKDMVLYFNIEIDTKNHPIVYPCIFEGVVSSCAYNYRILLELLYGKDWMLPHRWADSSTNELSKDIDMKQLNVCIGKRLKMSERCKDIKNLIVGERLCDDNGLKKNSTTI